MKRDKIVELMEICGTNTRCLEAMNLILDRFGLSLKQIGLDEMEMVDGLLARVKGILEARFPEYTELMINAYSETYSEEEVDELLRFYNSPLGQKMLNSQPVLSDKLSKAGEVWSNSLTRDLTSQLERGDLLLN